MVLFFVTWLICVVISIALVMATDKDIWLLGILVSGILCLSGAAITKCNPSSVLEKRHNVEFIDGVAGIVDLSKEFIKIQTKFSQSLKPGDIVVEKRDVYFDGSHGDSTYSLITPENNGENNAK